MKNMLSVLITVFLLFVAGYGQQSASIEIQFREKLERSWSLKYGTIYRVTSTSEHFDGKKKKGQLNYSEVHESLPPNLWRRVEVTVKDNKTRKLEQIGDDGTVYERVDGGAWNMWRGGIGNDINNKAATIEEAYRYLGQQTLNGNETDVYEVQTERNIDSEVNGQKLHETSTTKYWFLKDGRLLKSVRDNSIQGSVGIDRLTMVYQYEPKDLSFKFPRE